jgi:hypothetical protein
MHSMRRNLVALGISLSLGTLLAIGAGPSRAGESPAAATTPASCKPVSPVQVELAAGAAAGTWRVRVVAREAAESVVVTLRADQRAAQSVWRGALAAGETRDFTVRFASPRGRATLFAEAAVLDVPGMTQRAAASVAIADGKPDAVTAGAALGTLVPATTPQGEAVLELPGVTGASR